MSDITKITKNFGKIKSVFNNILSEGVIEKNEAKKGLFKEYLKAIKEDEILKTQFLVYTNIENKVENDATKAIQFVKENIELFSKFTKKQILESNHKLVQNILFEFEFQDERAELYENISTLIFTPRTPNTIDTIVEATSKVVEYILNHKPKVVTEAIELPTSMISTMMVDKYNEKYASLDESEKQVLKVLIESTDEEKKEVYSTTLRECIDLINEKLSTADLDTKDKLLRVKEKLLNDKQEINEDFFKNISKLVELKNNLK
jgi:hypothetical protein